MVEGLERSAFFGWADIAWVVAVLLGVWGAMIGVGEFALANVFMILTGVVCLSRLVKDCFHGGERRWLLFTGGFTVVCAILTVDLVLTHRKQMSSEAHDREIPSLQKEIGSYQKTVEDLTGQLQQAQAKAEQKVNDIQLENKNLRHSIEQKDAELVSIAKEQLELNYAPELVATTQSTLNTLFVMNTGKTTIRLLDMTLEGVGHAGGVKGGPSFPETIAPTNSATFELSDGLRNAAVIKAETQGTSEASYSGSLLISTANTIRYRMALTVTFDVRDGKVVKSFVTDGRIVPAKR